MAGGGLLRAPARTGPRRAAYSTTHELGRPPFPIATMLVFNSHQAIGTRPYVSSNRTMSSSPR